VLDVDDAQLLLRRLRVILVTTRAGARSLGTDDDQAAAAIRRGLAMLSVLETAAASVDDGAVLSQIEAGRSELTALLEERLT
jgi:hypothetical protein